MQIFYGEEEEEIARYYIINIILSYIYLIINNILISDISEITDLKLDKCIDLVTHRNSIERTL